MTRSRTTERQRIRQRQQRRQRLIAIGIVIAALVVLVAIFFVLANQPAEAPIPPETAARYEDIDQRRTQDGYPRLGDNDAPVEVALYCNFDSTACADFHDAIIDELVTRVRNGDINLTFVPLYSGTGNSEGAARAALCASEQQAFWAMHDSLYAWLQSYGAVQAFTHNRISSGVKNLGLDRGRYDGCIGGGAPDDVLFDALQDVRQLVNYTTTPAVTINNVVVVNEENVQATDSITILVAIDEAIAQRGSQPEATAEPGADATDEPASTAEPETDPTDEPIAEPAAEATAEATQE